MKDYRSRHDGPIMLRSPGRKRGLGAHVLVSRAVLGRHAAGTADECGQSPRSRIYGGEEDDVERADSAPWCIAARAYTSKTRGGVELPPLSVRLRNLDRYTRTRNRDERAHLGSECHTEDPGPRTFGRRRRDTQHRELRDNCVGIQLPDARAPTENGIRLGVVAPAAGREAASLRGVDQESSGKRTRQSNLARSPRHTDRGGASEPELPDWGAARCDRPRRVLIGRHPLPNGPGAKHRGEGGDVQYDGARSCHGAHAAARRVPRACARRPPNCRPIPSLVCYTPV